MRSTGILVLYSLLPLLYCSAIGIGQETTGSSKQTDAASADLPSLRKDGNSKSPRAVGESAWPTAKLRYMLDKNGQPVEVINGSSLEEFMEWLQNRNRPNGTITSLEIVGSADDDRANLKVTYTVLIKQSEEFVSVPLGLKEASLRNWRYRGDGQNAPDTEKRESDQGIVWWFRGKGEHHLELQISVPLMKQLPARRLVLSLPTAGISNMQLTLPYPTISTKVPSEQTEVQSKTVDGKSLVTAFGLGSKLDLTWQPNTESRPNEVALEVQTTIRAQIEADRVLIKADQNVKSQQGTFDQLIVRLPTGAESAKLEDADKLTYQFDPGNRQRALITLNEKSTSVQLNWILQLPAKMPMSLVIDGFAIEGARKQVGKIGLSIAEGLRISEPRDASLLGMNAGEFPPTLGPVVRAYQFLSQPFRLSASVDEVKPYFQVKPTIILHASAQHLTMEGDFEFRVDRDTLNEVVFTWPGHKSEGWTIDTVDEPGVVETYSVDDKGQITARLVKHRAGKFLVHFRAKRTIKPGDDLAISIPRPKSPSRLSATNLILVNAENVETDLSARGETVYHLLPSSSLDPELLPTASRGLKASSFRIDTDEQLFNLRVIPQKQRLRTETFSEVKWQDQQFHFVQRLHYDVSYERLSQLRLQVPPTVNFDRLRFTTGDDVELTKELIPATVGENRQVLLNLGDSVLGKVEVLARFSLPFKDALLDHEMVVELPLIGSADEPFSRTTVSLAQSDWFDAEPISPEIWKPQLNRQEAWQWMAEAAPAAIDLKVSRSSHVYETGNVSRALITISLDGTGGGAVRSQFRINTRSSLLPVIIPAAAKTPVFYWDNKRLPAREPIDSSSGTRQYTLQLPDVAGSNQSSFHLLTVDYWDSFESRMGWSDRLELRAPQLPTCSWWQVVWQTVLPSGQNLFTYPTSATPMFRWQRSGLMWGRVSTPDSDQLQQWVASGASDTAPPSDVLISERTGNLYSFSQFDSPKSLEFRTLSSSMVLLVGAGFSLIVGFLTFRVAVLQHVLTLLVVGVGLAVVGLWYAAPLELLFQPMLAGLMLATVAVMLEGWVRRRYDTTGLSFENQSEFPPMATFGSHYLVRQSDPNEATQLRPMIREGDSNVPVGAGSGVS